MSVCQTLMSVCQTLMSVCHTLMPVCHTLMSACHTHLKMLDPTGWIEHDVLEHAEQAGLEQHARDAHVEADAMQQLYYTVVRVLSVLLELRQQSHVRLNDLGLAEPENNGGIDETY